MQYHRKKDESIYVYKGRVLIRLDGGHGHVLSNVLGSGDCVRIEPLTLHRIEAMTNSILLEVSTSELRDG